MQAQLPPPPRADLDTSWLPPMLHGAGYSHAELLKIGSIADPGGLAAAEAKLKGGLGTPVFRTLARLFYLGNAVPTSFVDEALPGRGAAALVEAGLARTRGPDVVASASLTSLEGVYTASDPFASDGHPLTPGLESVLPVGNATQITSQLLSREPAQLALDLGCGQGYLSAVVAGYASRVIATDVSDRALGFTRFNARMNGRTNVEVRRGSLLEPVADLRGQFDLIACNAPFVLSATGSIASISGSGQGDDLVECLMRETPGMLRQGGRLVLACSWHHDEKDWSARPREWLSGKGIDAWLVRFSSTTSDHYANQIRSIEGDEAAQRWKDFAARHDIRFIAFGALVAQRREGDTWLRAEALNPIARREGPSPVTRIFANQRFIYAHRDPQQLRPIKLRVAPGVAGVQGKAPKTGAPVVQLQHASGFAMPTDVTPGVAQIIALFDGTRTTEEVLALVQTPKPEDLERGRQELLQVATMLLARGFVEIA